MSVIALTPQPYRPVRKDRTIPKIVALPGTPGPGEEDEDAEEEEEIPEEDVEYWEEEEGEGFPDETEELEGMEDEAQGESPAHAAGIRVAAPLPYAGPGKTPEEEELDESIEEEIEEDLEEEEFWEGEDGDAFDKELPEEEREEEREEKRNRRAITKLTIAIIPIEGARKKKRNMSYIGLSDMDMWDTDMYYDECDKPQVYAHLAAKLGKTGKELSAMLFGY